MATTIINPATSNADGNNGVGFLVGVIVFVIFAIIFFVYGLPLLRGIGGNGGIQVNVPVPKSIDVNVQQSK